MGYHSKSLEETQEYVDALERLVRGVPSSPVVALPRWPIGGRGWRCNCTKKSRVQAPAE